MSTFPQHGDRIRGFDGLRAFAFLLVFVSHKLHVPHRDRYGDIGVWLFFVLSGFLITRILAHSREKIESGGTTYRDRLVRFYLRRTARIFPIYYALLTVFTLASLIVSIGHFGPTEKLAYWLYGTNIMIALRSAWPGDFGHLWTLAIEEQFYLLFAPLVLLVMRRRAIWVCVAFVAVGFVTKLALELLGASDTSIDVNSLINFGLLGFGGILGLQAERRLPAWITSTPIQILVFGAYVFLAIALGGYTERWFVFGKLSALLPGLMLLQLFQNQASGWVAFLESAPLMYVGRVSYGAYLFHPFVQLDRLEGPLARFGINVSLSPALQAVGELIITLAISVLSWRLFEKPIVVWAARKTDRDLKRVASPRGAESYGNSSR